MDNPMTYDTLWFAKKYAVVSSMKQNHALVRFAQLHIYICIYIYYRHLIVGSSQQFHRQEPGKNQFLDEHLRFAGTFGIGLLGQTQADQWVKSVSLAWRSCLAGGVCVHPPPSSMHGSARASGPCASWKVDELLAGQKAGEPDAEDIMSDLKCFYEY